jgi:hypothetical protein
MRFGVPANRIGSVPGGRSDLVSGPHNLSVSRFRTALELRPPLGTYWVEGLYCPATRRLAGHLAFPF